MAKATATMTIPIYAKIDKAEHHIGDIVVPIKTVNGRPKAPTAREILTALRKVR